MDKASEVARWLQAVESEPEAYQLPRYGPFITPERIAEYFARWALDETEGQPPPALCRRCGRILHPLHVLRSSQQLHLQCEPPTPE